MSHLHASRLRWHSHGLHDPVRSRGEVVSLEPIAPEQSTPDALDREMEQHLLDGPVRGFLYGVVAAVSLGILLIAIAIIWSCSGLLHG